MKIFKEIPLITALSYVGIAACLATNLYLSDKVPEEHRLTEIEKEQVEISQTLDECDKGGYISLERKCLDAVQQFGTLGEEAAALQHSQAYISAQQKHAYSDIPIYVAAIFTLTSFIRARSSVKRRREEEEKNNSNWKKEFEAKYLHKGDQQ